MIIGKESETVEFKLTTSERKEATEAIAAMLNKHGKGTVYFGVDDDGFVRGQQISDGTKKDVAKSISDLIEPKISPTIEPLSVDGKEILKVTFSGRGGPYSSNGRYFMRVGTENRKMTAEDLREMIKHNDYSSPWENELTDHTIDDLDDDALLDFYKSAVACKRLEMKDYDKEKLLSHLGLIENGRCKNACYALFGKEAKIGLRLASYVNDNKVTFTDLKLINGNIYNLIDEALKYVKANIMWRPEIGMRKRVDVPEIPEEAIREIIVNAFAHCDYEVLPEIEIGIHPGLIEIYNPGTFPDRLTPLDFIKQNMPSFQRNKLILEILFRSKDVEKAGTGLQRVNELCTEAGVAWTFRKEAYGFFFEFIRSKRKAAANDSDLTSAEQEVLKLIGDNPRISKSELAASMQKSDKTVQRATKSLSERGMIERVGSSKSGYWTVK